MPQTWEWETEEEMQELLAGHTPREQYLSSRARTAESLADLFGLDGTQRGFEIGSGEGIVARALARRCRSLDCADPSLSFLNKARATCRELPNVRFHLIEDAYLEFLPPEYFDFGVATGVFIHFNAYDIFHYLCSVKQILKPGGLFYFEVATLDKDTHALFREHAQHYRQLPDPTACRTLMSWNDLGVVRAVIDEVGLMFRADQLRKRGGSIGILVEKRAGA